MYVAQTAAGSVAVLDPALRVVGTIAAGRFPGPLTFSSVLYVANAGDGTVTVIDPATPAPAPPLPVDAQPSGLATSPDGRLLYVANSGSDDLTVIDTAHAGDRRDRARRPRARGRRRRCAAGWVAGAARSRTVVDAASRAVVASVRVGSGPARWRSRATARMLYVADADEGTVRVVDTVTLDVGPPVDGRRGPGGDGGGAHRRAGVGRLPGRHVVTVVGPG